VRLFTRNENRLNFTSASLASLGLRAYTYAQASEMETCNYATLTVA
jgi:hypothetical protein